MFQGRKDFGKIGNFVLFALPYVPVMVFTVKVASPTYVCRTYGIGFPVLPLPSVKEDTCVFYI